MHIEPEGSGFEVAFPMGNVWGMSAPRLSAGVDRQITHLLGGSPHAQLAMAHRFPNLRSVDTNQVFWCAVNHGQVWDGRWVVPEPRLMNLECFKKSLSNITEAWSDFASAPLIQSTITESQEERTATY